MTDDLRNLFVLLILALAVLVLVLAKSHAGPTRTMGQGEPPYSCRLLYAEQGKCAFGSCDARTVDRLRKECLRDGGRP